MHVLIADDDSVSRRLLAELPAEVGIRGDRGEGRGRGVGPLRRGQFPHDHHRLDDAGAGRAGAAPAHPIGRAARLRLRHARHGEIREGGPGRGDGGRRGRLPDQAVRPGRAPGPVACRRADHPPGAEPARDQGGVDRDGEAREPGAPGGGGGPRDQQPARLRRQQPGRAAPGRAGRHARAGQVPGRGRLPGAGGAGARRRGGPPGGGDRPALPPRESPPTVRELGRGAATGPRHRPEPARFRPAGRGGIQGSGRQRRPPIHPGSTPPRVLQEGDPRGDRPSSNSPR